METELQGDDLSQDVEQGHFDEFGALEQVAAEIDPQPVTETSAGGNPVNDAVPAEPVNEVHISGAEIIAPVVNLACTVLCPNWEIKPEEQAVLADAYGQVLDKYFPNGVGEYGVELGAVLATAAILTPKLGIPRHKEHEEKEVKDNGKAKD